MRRESSWAPATASWDLSVSFLKSMVSSVGARYISPLRPPRRMLRRAVEDDLAFVRAVHGRDLGAQLALQPLHPDVQTPELVLEPQHVLDTGQVEPELRGQPLDEPQ